MNKDIFEGKWKQIRGEAKAWWGKLTDNDLDRAAGKFDVFVGLLQEKYGYTRQRAVEEIDKHVTEYEASLKKKTVPPPLYPPVSDRSGATTPSLLRRGMDQQKNIHIGDKDEYLRK